MKTEAVASPDPVICPHCERTVKPMVFGDAETVSLDLATVDPSRFAVYLLWGDCPHCGKQVHAVELGIASAEAPGRHLIVDHCHKADRSQLYRVTAGERSWTVEHFSDVSEASYEDGTGSLNWLDIHLLRVFAAGEASPFDLAKVFARTHVPQLLTLWEA